MIWAIILSVILILIIQYFLYKDKIGKFVLKKDMLVELIKNIELTSLLKELLIVFIGAFIALYITNYSNDVNRENSVNKLLDAAYSDIANECDMNTTILSRYENGTMSTSQVYYNTQHHTDVLENILDNDTVITTMSAISYSRILNDMRNLNDAYNMLTTADPNSDAVITCVKMMKSHCENLLYYMEIEKNILMGYSMRTNYNHYIKNI